MSIRSSGSLESLESSSNGVFRSPLGGSPKDRSPDASCSEDMSTPTKSSGSGSAVASPSGSESPLATHLRGKGGDVAHGLEIQPYVPRAAPSEKYEGSPSKLANGTLAFIRDRYEVPASVGMRFSMCDETIENPIAGHVAFYEKMFEFGVRLPLHPFAQECLAEVNLALAQLAPNG